MKPKGPIVCGCDECHPELHYGQPDGPLSSFESDLAAMESRYKGLIQDAKRVREHLTHCDVYGDQPTLDGFDRILMALGIHNEVTKPEPIPEQPKDFALTQDSPDPF